MRRALGILLLLILARSPAFADPPTLSETLDWIRAKLRARGRVEFRDDSVPDFPAVVTIEQSITWGGDGCVVTYRQKP